MNSGDSVTSKYFKDEVFKFNYKHYFPLGFVFVALILAVIGFMILDKVPVLGAVLILCFLLTLIAKDTIQINFKSMTFRDAMSVFGFCFGTWQNLPDVEYISIFPTRVSQTMNSVRGVQSTTINEVHLRINLIYNKNRRLHVFSASSVAIAHRVAEELSNRLDCGIYDCSGTENVWLKQR